MCVSLSVIELFQKISSFNYIFFMYFAKKRVYMYTFTDLFFSISNQVNGLE